MLVGTFTIFCCQSLLAQQNKLDSLKFVVENSKEDTVKVVTLRSLANELYWEGHYDESLEISEVLRRLSRKLGYDKGFGYSFIIAGQNYIRKGNYDSAFNNFQKAVAVFSKLRIHTEEASSHLYLGQVYDYKAKYTEALKQYSYALERLKGTPNELLHVKIFNSLAITHLNRGSYEISLEYCLKAIKISSRLNNDRIHASILNNIGAVYARLSEYENALKYFLLYLEVMNRLNIKYPLGVAYLNIGETYKNLDQYKQAIVNLNEAVKIQTEINDKRGLALSFSNLGDIYKKQKQLKIAQKYYEKSSVLAKAIKDEEVLLNPLEGLGDLYLRRGDFVKAKQITHEVLTIAKKIGSRSWVDKAFLSCSKLDSAIGDFAHAYECFKKHSALHDSLFNERKSQQIVSMQELYESDRKDKEIKLLSETNKVVELQRASTKKISTVSIFFLSLIILGMIFWLLYKAKNSKILKSQKDKIFHANQELTSLLSKIENQNEMLAQKNENLEELHREKDGLIGIVAHDLRSPLTRIKGLSALVELSGNLTYEQKDMIGKISKVCEDGNGLIRDLLVINQYESADMLTLNSIEINHFIYSMLANYTHALQAKNLKINFDLPLEERFIIVDDSYLTRILDNLLTNAIKFSPKGKSIFINIISTQEFIKISIQDEGPGFSKEDLPHLFKKFKKLSARPTAGENSTGLGLSIVKLLVEKLKGSIAVESTPGNGATFIISLPLNLVSLNSVEELALPEQLI